MWLPAITDLLIYLFFQSFYFKIFLLIWQSDLVFDLRKYFLYALLGLFSLHFNL